MSTKLTWQTISTDSGATMRLGELLGSRLVGGEVIELVADLGGGKTTFTKGLIKGLGSQDNVASPTFTLNKVYKCRDGLEAHHFDFYRLSEPGVVADQLAESVSDQEVITVVEWGDIVQGVLPSSRISISFVPTPNDPDERQITISYSENYSDLIKTIQAGWEEVRP